MQTSTIVILIAILVLLVGGGLWYFGALGGTTATSTPILSFADCAAAGYPIQESYPRRCSVNGQTFIEEIGPIATSTADLIHVTAPVANALVSSPLTVTGEARGTWYFEASFPVELRDASGTLLAQVPAEAQGDWMTTNFVPFQIELDFQTPTTTTGILILRKDNPSGLPQHDASLSIPIRFR